MPIYNLMEDAATAEISRAQVWQWVQARRKLDDGRTVTAELVREVVSGQRSRLAAQMPARELDLACKLYEEMMLARDFPEFLTLPAYDLLD